MFRFQKQHLVPGDKLENAGKQSKEKFTHDLAIQRQLTLYLLNIHLAFSLRVQYIPVFIYKN